MSRLVRVVSIAALSLVLFAAPASAARGGKKHAQAALAIDAGCTATASVVDGYVFFDVTVDFLVPVAQAYGIIVTQPAGTQTGDLRYPDNDPTNDIPDGTLSFVGPYGAEPGTYLFDVSDNIHFGVDSGTVFASCSVDVA